MIKKLIIALSIFGFLTFNTQAQMDARTRAVITMALYGTVGGALLGTAALAFDADGRSVAIGASVGLYTGLLFGGYVVGTHYMKKKRRMNPVPQRNYYPDTDSSPYENPEGGYDEQGYFMNKADLSELEVATAPADISQRKSPMQKPTYYINLLNYQF